jgi:hypothetical protein
MKKEYWDWEREVIPFGLDLDDLIDVLGLIEVPCEFIGDFYDVGYGFSKIKENKTSNKNEKPYVTLVSKLFDSGDLVRSNRLHPSDREITLEIDCGYPGYPQFEHYQKTVRYLKNGQRSPYMTDSQLAADTAFRDYLIQALENIIAVRLILPTEIVHFGPFTCEGEIALPRKKAV